MTHKANEPKLPGVGRTVEKTEVVHETSFCGFVCPGVCGLKWQESKPTEIYRLIKVSNPMKNWTKGAFYVSWGCWKVGFVYGAFTLVSPSYTNFRSNFPFREGDWCLIDLKVPLSAANALKASILQWRWVSYGLRMATRDNDRRACCDTQGLETLRCRSTAIDYETTIQSSR